MIYFYIFKIIYVIVKINIQLASIPPKWSNILHIQLLFCFLYACKEAEWVLHLVTQNIVIII